MSGIHETTRIERAGAMRAMSEDVRDELIAASRVLDLRPRLHELAKQRQLATAYRAPAGPKGAA